MPVIKDLIANEASGKSFVPLEWFCSWEYLAYIIRKSNTKLFLNFLVTLSNKDLMKSNFSWKNFVKKHPRVLVYVSAMYFLWLYTQIVIIISFSVAWYSVCLPLYDIVGEVRLWRLHTEYTSHPNSEERDIFSLLYTRICVWKGMLSCNLLFLTYTYLPTYRRVNIIWKTITTLLCIRGVDLSSLI